jgi:hypothetical protein
VERVVGDVSFLVAAHLIDLRLQVVNDSFDLGASSAEIGGGGLQRGHPLVTLSVDVVEVEGLLIEDGSLQQAQSLLDGVVARGDVAVEVGEAASPLVVLVLEAAAKLLLRLHDLVEDQL